MKIEKLKALALGGEFGGVILAVVVVTMQTKKVMQKNARPRGRFAKGGGKA